MPSGQLNIIFCSSFSRIFYYFLLEPQVMIKIAKYPAKVGHGMIHGLWYEYWNDMSWRPTIKTRIILFIRKWLRNKK